MAIAQLGVTLISKAIRVALGLQVILDRRALVDKAATVDIMAHLVPTVCQERKVRRY